MIRFGLLSYVALSGILLLVCWMIYRWLFEFKVSPQINRWVVLSIFFLSSLIPAVVMLFPVTLETSDTILETSLLIGQTEVQPAKISSGPAVVLISVLKWIYVGGALLTLSVILIGQLKLIGLYRNSVKIRKEGRDVYVHDNRMLASFSWFGKIFIYEDSFTDDGNNGNILLTHEIAHATMRHWVDLLISQIVIVFQWFNPVSWWLRAELQRIHEYQADGMVLASGVGETEYRMLLIGNIPGIRFLGLTDGLNECSIKKRLLMMERTTFTSRPFLRISLLVFLMAVAGILFHSKAVASAMGVIVSRPGSQSEIIVNGESNGEISGVPVVPAELQDKMPEYEGGQDQLLRDLASIIKYPSGELDNHGIVRVVVGFTIEDDGKITHMRILTSGGETFDNVAIEAVESLPGKWIPGYSGGRAVPVDFALPLVFRNPVAGVE